MLKHEEVRNVFILKKKSFAKILVNYPANGVLTLILLYSIKLKKERKNLNLKTEVRTCSFFLAGAGNTGKLNTERAGRGYLSGQSRFKSVWASIFEPNRKLFGFGFRSNRSERIKKYWTEPIQGRLDRFVGLTKIRKWKKNTHNNYHPLFQNCFIQLNFFFWIDITKLTLIYFNI